MTRLRPPLALATPVAVFALCVGLALPAAPATPARTRPSAHVDPVLAERLGRGPASALLTWDDERVSRGGVAQHLGAVGTEVLFFDELSIALVCMGSARELPAVASTPGAVSLWGDRRLEPALDQSVPTAFNGDPRNVWEGLGVTGKGVGIAVLDTGLDGNHPDLESGIRTKLNVRVLVGHDIFGPGVDPCVQDTYSDPLRDSELTSGHGTHIAGVAAGDGTASGGRYTGVAPKSDLMGVGINETITPRVDEPNIQVYVSLFSAIAGINYILTCGLGEPNPERGCPEPMLVKSVLAGWVERGLYDPWHPLTSAISTLYEFGITVVFPAGNQGPQVSDCSKPETCRVNQMVANPYGVSVAATPKRSRTAVEPYSSRGDPQDQIARGEVIRYQPTLAAPGTGVVAARRVGLAPFVQPPGSNMGAGGDGAVHVDPRYVGLTGTSVAAGHVAGAVALMQEAAVKAKGCYLRTFQVHEALRSTATAMPGYQPWEVGAGALDIAAAVQKARDMPALIAPDPWLCPGL
jgi:serine protease AprX